MSLGTVPGVWLIRSFWHTSMYYNILIDFFQHLLEKDGFGLSSNYSFPLLSQPFPQLNR